MQLTDEGRRRLSDQSSFLRTSLDAFFRHTPAEAVRIATTLRVLVHETAPRSDSTATTTSPMTAATAPPSPIAPSVSLLHQIDDDYLSLIILDRATGFPGLLEAAKVGNVGMWSPMPVRLGGPPLSHFEVVESALYPRVPLMTWWREVPAMILGDDEIKGPRTFTREGLVKILANKEGGAHMDPDGPPAYYRRLIIDRPVRVTQQGITGSLDAAYWVVAQSGAEMLEALERRYGICFA